MSAYWTPNTYAMPYGNAYGYTSAYPSSYGYDPSTGAYPYGGGYYQSYNPYGGMSPYYTPYYNAFPHGYDSFETPEEEEKPPEKPAPTILSDPGKVISKITEENATSALKAFLTGLSMGAIPAIGTLLLVPFMIRSRGGTFTQGIKTAVASSLAVLFIGGSAGVAWTFRDKYKKLFRQIKGKFM